VRLLTHLLELEGDNGDKQGLEYASNSDPISSTRFEQFSTWHISTICVAIFGLGSWPHTLLAGWVACCEVVYCVCGRPRALGWCTWFRVKCSEVL